GFAVVAIEIRSLAQRSAEAAKEIKELITDSLDKVENGSKYVGENAKKLLDIVDNIKQVANLMNEISAATKEQYSGIEQINKAVSQNDYATQQNAAMVKESASASHRMAREAENMKELIQKNFSVRMDSKKRVSKKGVESDDVSSVDFDDDKFAQASAASAASFQQTGAMMGELNKNKVIQPNFTETETHHQAKAPNGDIVESILSKDKDKDVKHSEKGESSF
ncbi:MAG: methyl-accepting chemotaxis protein, partial [Candidatus Hodarchaeales archaeon]